MLTVEGGICAAVLLVRLAHPSRGCTAHTAKNHPSPNHCPSLLASDGCCRTNKASFHAAGAPAAPALRPLAAVARESSSRVDQVSCRERVFFSPVSRATRTGLSSGADERPPLQEMDHYRQDDRRRCRWQLPTHTRTAECLAVRLQVRWTAAKEDASEDERCSLAGGSAPGPA